MVVEQKKKNNRPQLGRGLAALLGDVVPSSPLENRSVPLHDKVEGASFLPIEKLEPSPFQPRQIMPEEGLKELADSLKSRGILQPLLVRPSPEKGGMYQIVGGERRWRAAQLAGLHEVPVFIRPLDDSDAMVASLVENLQRADLNAIEEAEGLHKLQKDYNLTQEELAQAVGKSRPHIANTLRLLHLPAMVKEKLHANMLTAGHARALLAAKDPVAVAHMAIQKEWSVRQTEEWVQKESRTSFPVKKKEDASSREEIAALEHSLKRKLGLDVKIAFNGKGGSIKISYSSLDQFDGLLALLNRSNSF